MADAAAPRGASGEGPVIAEIQPEVIKPEATAEAKLDVAAAVQSDVPLDVQSEAPKQGTPVEAKPEAELVTDGISLANAETQEKANPNVDEVKAEAQVQTETDSPVTPSQKEQEVTVPQAASSASKETELLKRIEELEKPDAAADKLKSELKTREEEVELLKARVKNLETELQAALLKPGSKNHEMVETIKQQHEELLGKARGMIFDKTKIVKNQELQIEALYTQVQSLKDINTITKDLLEIRNSEMKAMEDRLETMEAKFKAEKERHGLMLQKAETSTNLNGDLKKEYEMQLRLFKELRVKYEERVKALVDENARLKDLTITLKGDPTPPATQE